MKLSIVVDVELEPKHDGYGDATAHQSEMTVTATYQGEILGRVSVLAGSKEMSDLTQSMILTSVYTAIRKELKEKNHAG